MGGDKKTADPSLRTGQTGFELLTGESKYRSLIENTNYIIYSLNSEGVFTFVSPSWTRLVGHEASEVNGRSYRDFVHPDDLQICSAYFRKVIETGERQEGVEYRVRCKDGQWRWHTSSANPFRDESGVVAGYDGIARDITENRIVEHELLLSRSKLRAMLDNLPFLAWLKDADGRFEAVNEAFARSCSQTVDGIIGCTDFDVWPAENAAKYRADDVEVMRSGVRKEVEEAITDSQGRTWFETCKTPVFNEKGCVVGTAGFSRDITWRKEQLEELEGFFTVNLDLLCIADIDGNFLKTNEAWSRILGYSAEDLKKMTFLEFVHPDDMRSTLDAMADLARGEEILNYTNRYRCKDGTYRYIEWRSHPMGRLVYAAARDITERIKAEEALRQSETNLRSIIENSPVGFHIYNIDLQGRLIFSMFNNAADIILRAGHQQFMGREILDAFPALAGTGIPEMYTAVARGELMTQNFEAPYDEGGIRGVYEVRVFRGAPGQAVVNFVDITERKAAEEQIARAQRLLGAKNKELEQLIYVASHDLRSPLVNVDGFSRELEYSIREIGALLDESSLCADIEKAVRAAFPDMSKALERIRASTRQMDDLLKSLLTLSRMGRAALQIGTVDMNGVLRQLSSSFAFRIRQSGITLVVEDLPPCEADFTQVTQIFANLIDNAIKYRSPDRAGMIRVHGALEDNFAVYRVEDNGIGISENHHEKVFELFHRLNPKQTEGEGLGLTAVKQILARLDGDIALESRENNGCVFTVRLPPAGRER